MRCAAIDEAESASSAKYRTEKTKVGIQRLCVEYTLPSQAVMLGR